MKKFFLERFKWLFVFIALTACVDRINVNIPAAQAFIVIEGMITDNKGPYTVKVSRGLSLDSSTSSSPVSDLKIKIYDDMGNNESLAEISPGEYTTAGIVQGEVGRSYHLEVETPEGQTYISENDTINSVGEIQEIKYVYEPRLVETIFGDVDANVFKIYVDSYAGTGNQNLVRWRFTGTYKIVTKPELREIVDDWPPYAAPYPCSGYIVVPPGKLLQVGSCTCCTCWINQFESIPQLSDEQLITNGQFSNVKVGEVPITSLTFSNRYMVKVDQMSLSKRAFEFFKLIRAQKEDATSLFQPPYGQINGNIKSLNQNYKVVGLFWATSVKSKIIFLDKNAVPYILTLPDVEAEPCTAYANSFTNKPEFWE